MSATVTLSFSQASLVHSPAPHPKTLNAQQLHFHELHRQAREGEDYSPILGKMVKDKAWRGLNSEDAVHVFSYVCARKSSEERVDWALRFLESGNFRQKTECKERRARMLSAFTCLSSESDALLQKCSGTVLGFLFNYSCAIGAYRLFVAKILGNSRWEGISIEHQMQGFYYSTINAPDLSKHLFQKISCAQLASFLCAKHLRSTLKGKVIPRVIEGVFRLCTSKQLKRFEDAMLASLYAKNTPEEQQRLATNYFQTPIESRGTLLLDLLRVKAWATLRISIGASSSSPRSS